MKNYKNFRKKTIHRTQFMKINFVLKIDKINLKKDENKTQ